LLYLPAIAKAIAFAGGPIEPQGKIINILAKFLIFDYLNICFFLSGSRLFINLLIKLIINLWKKMSPC
jgi:hypothetical protein